MKIRVRLQTKYHSDHVYWLRFFDSSVTETGAVFYQDGDVNPEGLYDGALKLVCTPAAAERFEVGKEYEFEIRPAGGVDIPD